MQKNTRKKEKLEAEVEQCSLKLGRAEQLIGALNHTSHSACYADAHVKGVFELCARAP